MIHLIALTQDLAGNVIPQKTVCDIPLEGLKSDDQAVFACSEFDQLDCPACITRLCPECEGLGFRMAPGKVAPRFPEPVRCEKCHGRGHAISFLSRLGRPSSEFGKAAEPAAEVPNENRE